MIRRLNTPTGLPTVGSKFAFGVLSLENNPIGTLDSYRFVKVNNNAIAEGDAAAGQVEEALKGRYGHNCEILKFGDGPQAEAALLAIENEIALGSSTPGVFHNTESAFSRGKLKHNTQPYTVYRSVL